MNNDPDSDNISEPTGEPDGDGEDYDYDNENEENLEGSEQDASNVGSVDSSKRSREGVDDEQTIANKKMAAHARVLNANRSASKVFPNGGFKSAAFKTNRSIFPMNDPEEVDNKLHLWKSNCASVPNENGELPNEPTWFELYEKDENSACRAFTALCFDTGCTNAQLIKAGYPQNMYVELLSQHTVPEVKSFVRDCIKQPAPLSVSQTMVTTHVPALTKLAPNMVADFAARLLADFNIGHSYDLQQILVNHADTLTVLFKSKGLLKEADDVQVWSRWAVPVFCENLLLVIPRDSSLTASTIALVQQLADLRHDFGDPPTMELAIKFLDLVHTTIRDSTQKLTPSVQLAAVKALTRGLINSKNPDNSHRVVQPANIQLNLLLKDDPTIKTVEKLLTTVTSTIGEIATAAVKFGQWTTLGPVSKQGNTFDKNKDRNKGFNKSNSSNGSNSNNNNRNNNSGGNSKNADTSQSAGDNPCPGGKCYGCGRVHAGPGKLCRRAACKGHPDRNVADMPFEQSAAAAKQRSRDYKWAHELDTKFRANGDKLTEAEIAKINSFKGAEPNKPNKPKNGKPHGKSECLAVIPDEVGVCLPQFKVFSNPTNHLIVDTLLDTGALQGNYLSQDLATWLIDQGAVPVHNGAVSIQLAVKDNTTTSSCSLAFNVTFLNELSGLHETILNLKARILDSHHDLIIGRPVIRLHSLCDKIPSFFKLDDSSAPVVKQPRLSDLPRAHSLRSVFGGDTILESEGTLRAKREREIQRPPLADQQLCIIGEIKAKRELIDTAPDFDHVQWADNPFDVSVSTDPTNNLHDLDLVSKIEMHGSLPLQAKLRDLCKRYSDIFSVSVRSNPAQIPPMELQVDSSKWKSNKNRGPPRPQSRDKQKEIAKQVNNYLQLGVVRPVNAEEYSQVHLVPKPTPNEWRFCLDFVRLNDCTDGVEGWPIPNIKHMLDRIGERKSRLFGVMDMTSGYHQAPISASSQILTAFICFMGIFCWMRVPMGLKNAASYFQRVMATVVLIGLIYLICELYIDDILVFGKDDEDFLHNLEEVFKRLRQYNVTLNPKKCRFGMDKVEYVGHVISYEGITFSTEKREKVLDFPLPNTQKELQGFIGLVNYFRDHVPDMTGLVKPLRVLIDTKKKNQRLTWTSIATENFYKVRDIVANCPTLYFVDEHAPIVVMTDASDYGIGAYIYQLIDNKERPIIFYSSALSGAELNWSTIEKEGYAIFATLTKYSHLLRDNKFLLKTDHMNLTYINLGTSQKVQRWKLALQEFDFDIEHVAGKLNVVADAFSRLVVNNQPTRISSDVVESISNIEVFPIRIPEEQYRLIGRHHNSTVGHFGVDKTISMLQSSEQSWKYMRKHVRQFIQQCPVCQKLREHHHEIKTHPFTTASYLPMDVLNIDTIGPVAKDAQGNEYIIVIIDCFTRWVELFGVPDTSALSAARALLQHVGRFGTPGIIRSDRGSQYVNNLLTEFSTLVVLTPEYTLAYSKEENSIVERCNKEVMRHLRAIILEKRVQENWSTDQLPLVQRILNCEVKKNTGVSPAELLFGNVIDLGRRVLRKPVHMSEQPMTEYMDNLLAQQALLIKVAQETQLSHDSHHLSGFDIDFTEYPINSYVLLNPPEGNRPKLSPKLKGPYRVVNFVGSKYTIQDLLTSKNFDIHISKLSPFNFDDTRTDPKTIAMDDAQEFVIDSVIAHRGDRSRRGTMEFLVKWQGYSDDANSWEPYSNLRDTDHLLEYLRANKLKSLIPNKHK